MAKLFNPNKKIIKRLEQESIQVEEMRARMRDLSDYELKMKTQEFKERYTKGDSLDNMRIEAFAVCGEASRRVLGMEPYRVQVMGSLALYEGNIPEMKTGEGKTLTATMAVYLNAISGKGVHVVTVNEYLSERDANEMGILYEWLGLSVGFNSSKLSPQEKKAAYSADITYTTNSELGFDYLRDNMVYSNEMKVQRELSFAVIDEVDSILIDEARTPLIVSGPSNKSSSIYKQTNMFVQYLEKEDYRFDASNKTVVLQDSGVEKAELSFGIDNLYSLEHIFLNHAITQALNANVSLHKEIDYIVENGEVLIVDALTGRTMKGRRYSDGLHQAIEAKEGLEIQKESQTIASITFQNYFRMYSKLSGMTGTALTEAEEFLNIYNILVLEIPTNKPVSRIDKKDLVYRTLNQKYNAIVSKAKEYNEKGQPVLIGTTSIETSELISKMLTEAGVQHDVLNAKNHERESEIIKNAGQIGSVTVATNMAGRGTDIKPGEGVLELGGLAVIGTERHESRRIDNQLRGRSGRQGNVGETQFYLSLEDEIMVRLGAEKMEVVFDKLKMDDDQPIELGFVSKTVEAAQKRSEGNNYEARKQVLQFDDILREQRTIIYEERDKVLTTTETKDKVQRMISEVIEGFLTSLEENEEYFLRIESFLNKNFLEENTLTANQMEGTSLEELKDLVLSTVIQRYEQQEEQIGSENMRELEKMILLRAIDIHWISHMESMQHLKEGIHLRAYAQIDPVKAYEREGFEMFGDTIQMIENYTATHILKSKLPEKE